VNAKAELPPARGKMRAEERENGRIRSMSVDAQRKQSFRGDFCILLELVARGCRENEDAIPHPPLLRTV
jgi:hypothetical protein